MYRCGGPHAISPHLLSPHVRMPMSGRGIMSVKRITSFIPLKGLLFFVILVQINQVFATEDPDVNRNVSELITSKGYPVEEYEVQTEDGYILLLVRIPHGKNATITSKKQVAFLQHGVMGAATDWLLNFEKNSLAFVLADAGYDVWLGNSRGNKYSRKHIDLSPKDRKFWDFSFDEMGIYDLPATIDFVLNATKQPNLYYIAHSQGNTILFILLSEKPEYKDKILIGISLAPVVFLSHLKSLAHTVSPIADVIKTGLDLFDKGEFMPSDSLLYKTEQSLCNTKKKIICEDALFLITGPDPEETNTTRLPVYAAHFPAGTSTKDLVHFAQEVISGKFRKYDYGLFGNLKRYKTASPPEYQIETITTPIAVLWGENDWIADPKDVANLASKLKNVVLNRKVPFPKWNHGDFILGVDADKYLFPDILNLLKQF